MTDFAGISVIRVAAGQIPANLNGSVDLHPQGHINLFMSEPLAYTNPHIWAAYLFAMLGLGIAAVCLLYRQRNRLSRNREEFGGASCARVTPKAGLPWEPVGTTALDKEDEQFFRLKTKRDLLLRKIKVLDDNFACGELDGDVYRETKEDYNELLKNTEVQLREYI